MSEEQKESPIDSIKEQLKFPKHVKYPEIKHFCEARLPLYLHGPTGSGKTHIFRDVAKELGLTFYKKLIGAQMSESSLLGYNDAHGKYVEGIVFKPYTEGGLLVLDEIDNGNPNTNLVVNGVCDQELAFPCGMKERHKDFVVVATANTTGNGATLQYVGRNKLDAAMLNRFVFVEFNYDLALEEKLALLEFATWWPNKTTPPTTEQLEIFEASIHDFWRLREALKQNGLDNHILSQRNLLQQSRMLATDFSKESILNAVLMRNLSTDIKNKVINSAKLIKINDIKQKYNAETFQLSETEKNKVLLDVEKDVKTFMDTMINTARNKLRVVELQTQQAKAMLESDKLKDLNQQIKIAEQKLAEEKAKIAKQKPPEQKVGDPSPFNKTKPGKSIPNWDESIMGLGGKE